MTKAMCGNCGREYDIPNIPSINCVCGAKIFMPKEEPKPEPLKPPEIKKPEPPKEEAKKEEKPPVPPKEEKKKVAEKKKVISKRERLIKKLKKNIQSKSSPKAIDDLDKQIKDIDNELEKLDQPPKLPEKSLREKLVAIPGIAEKTAEEICEEYKNTEQIKAAIKNNTFAVGGVGFIKKQLILRLLR